uniref:Transcriptional regulator, MarR family n=1 Tax=Mycobacterium sp. (strain KMS) TaxID=189918 RepID=A1UQC3_MYCSK
MRDSTVMRQTIPTNRRYKVVSLTDAGWSMVATINAVDDPAPEALAALEGNELRALRDAIARVSAARQTLNESRGRIAQRTTLSPA